MLEKIEITVGIPKYIKLFNEYSMEYEIFAEKNRMLREKLDNLDVTRERLEKKLKKIESSLRDKKQIAIKLKINRKSDSKTVELKELYKQLAEADKRLKIQRRNATSKTKKIEKETAEIRGNCEFLQEEIDLREKRQEGLVRQLGMIM